MEYKIKNDTLVALKKDIFGMVRAYYRMAHKEKRKTAFIPGISNVHYAGRIYDHREIVNLVDSALEFWLTAGSYANMCEEKIRNFFKAKKFYLVNSGSSANLVMISSLRSPLFVGQLKPGDEVITPAVTFPTTIAPIIQNQLIPVFVDCQIGTCNIDAEKIEGAVSVKTKAIFIPHTLGNPCNMDIIMDIAKRKGLIVIEDACDALGSRYDGRLVGTFGSMASLSFFPAHHITTGEGGGVVINDQRFSRIAVSLRDWGRDCWCDPGKDNSCGQRFTQKVGKLPVGYDHKYIYSHIGYNLKITEMQAAVGVAQFEKLKQLEDARKVNFNYYYEHLKPYADRIFLPQWEKKSDPSWFGFPVTVKDGISVCKLIQYLEDSGIQTRRMFGGNVLRQPAFLRIKRRIHGNLKNSDIIMKRTFFIGVYKGITPSMRMFVVARLKKFLKNKPFGSSVT